MKTTSISVLATGLALLGAGAAAAQTADPKTYVDLNIGGQTQSVTVATSSTFSLYGEQGTTSTNQTVGKGLVFDGGAGYFVRKTLAIGAAVSMFSRSPEGTASVTIPDPVAFNSFTTVAASPQLTQTEVGVHVKLVYVLRLNDQTQVALSGGPSFVHLSKQIVDASVVNGAAQLAVTTQTGTSAGANLGVDLNYLFTPRVGGGIFVRYILGQVDLPAASGVKVGGPQAGLGLRFRF
jgi:Outer membrane protein beta-barrel domain